MASLPDQPLSRVIRETVPGTGDVFVYFGKDGKLYRRIGDSGVFTVLADLTPSDPLMTIALGAKDYATRDLHKCVLTTTGLVLVTYVMGASGTGWGSEFRIVNMSGTIVASVTVQAVEVDFPSYYYAQIPAATYDYTNSLFKILYCTQFSSMGGSYQRFQYGTITTAGVLTSVTTLEELDLDANQKQLEYWNAYWTIDFALCCLRGNTASAQWNVSTATKTTNLEQHCLPSNVVYKDDGTTGEATYIIAPSSGGSGARVSVYSAINSGGSRALTLLATSGYVPSSATQVNGGGGRLSSDGNTLFVYILCKMTDDSYTLNSYELDVSIAPTTARSLVYKDSATITLEVLSAGLAPYETVWGLKDAALDTKVNYLYQYISTPHDMYESSVTIEITIGSDASIDLSLSGIVPFIDMHAYHPERDVTIELALGGIVAFIEAKVGTPIFQSFIQLNHSLEAYSFSSEDIKYSLTVGALVIPMVDFSLYRFKELSGLVKERIRVSIPVAFYQSIIEELGSTLTIYKFIGSNFQPLATVLLTEMYYEGKQTATIIGEAIPEIQIKNNSFDANKIAYIRNDATNKSIRIEPNLSLFVGDTLNYNFNNTMQVTSATTFISRSAGFTEVSD